MPDLSYTEIDDRVLSGMRPPRPFFYAVMALLAGGVGMLFLLWLIQILNGLGVTHLHDSIDWGTYITNFVFWVGIAHSGTLISAILYLARARWRDAVSRSAEAMTVFAVMIAGLFPLVHLGRVWVVYYLIPYPSQRQLWPNFLSPLVWDVLAVTTYLTVSTIFFYVGLIPDLATARDRAELMLGRESVRARVYRIAALGWRGLGSQWRHYDRGYLFFAALATPLVISVHSIVSWDFAMSLLKGWHSTLFAPYFVAGAIHSGLAMVLTLLIPLRSILGLERIMTMWHLEQIAKTILVTTSIVAYAYVVEPFIAWYAGGTFDTQFMLFRQTGWIAPVYWALFVLNVFAPLLFVFKRFRTSLAALWGVSLLINAGMWLERFMIITSSLGHDYLPHYWTYYFPGVVEIGITIGSFSMFFFLFLAFSKFLPTVPMADLKGQIAERRLEHGEGHESWWRTTPARQGNPGVIAVYGDPASLLSGMERACDAGFLHVEYYSPMKIEPAQAILGRASSPVRVWALAGALAGLAGGFALAIYAASSFGLIAGGKHPVALIPYCIVGFEGLILIGSLANLAGVVLHARLWSLKPPVVYDRRFSRDKFGLLVECDPADVDRVQKVLEPSGPEEMHAV